MSQSSLASNQTRSSFIAVACLLTGTQRAAVATIALQGPDAQTALQQFFTANSPRPLHLNELRYGQWCSASNNAEHVVVLKIDDTQHSSCDPVDPSISTKWEIHCHGGALAADRILSDLASVHVDIVEQQAFVARQQPRLLLRETDDVISRTLTIRTARFALTQLKYGLNDFAARAYQQLPGEWETVRSDATRMQRFSSFGMHLTKPWRIVLAGLPNVGKSSLMNALVGFQRSITYDLPGTTRDVVTCDGAIDGWPVLFSDTAGIRDQATDTIEQQGIERAKRAIAQADLIVMVQDATKPDDLFPLLLPADKRCIQVINKIDQVDAPLQTVDTDNLFTSTVSGSGLPELIAAIGKALVPELPSDDHAFPMNERQAKLVQELSVALDAERVRLGLEQLLGIDTNQSDHSPSVA